MESRVAKLEVIAANVLSCLAKIEATMATKEDLHRLEVTLIKWVVGTAGAVSIAMATIMTFVLNNAIPKSAPPLSPPVAAQPIVIVVPMPAGVQWQAQPPKQP